jgi:hypothetical protein
VGRSKMHYKPRGQTGLIQLGGRRPVATRHARCARSTPLFSPATVTATPLGQMILVLQGQGPRTPPREPPPSSRPAKWPAQPKILPARATRVLGADGDRAPPCGIRHAGRSKDDTMMIKIASRCWIIRCPPRGAYLGRLASIVPLNPLGADCVFWRHRVILRTRSILESHLRSPVYTPTPIARLAYRYSLSPPSLL